MDLVVRLVFAVALVLLSAPSWAQLSYFVLIDSDNNSATGCAVTLPTSGTVMGIERRLATTVSESTAPQVTQLTLESCISTHPRKLYRRQLRPPDCIAWCPLSGGIEQRRKWS